VDTTETPFAANHEDFHRRAAAGGTRHGNQLETVQEADPWLPKK
jgi:hypothetical protein